MAATLMLAAPTYAEVAKHAVDIQPTEVGTTEDIEPKSVAVSSDGTHLTFVFDTGQDIREYLLNNQAGGVAEIWIDNDLDTATGGVPFFSDIGGFDFGVDPVYLCKGFKDDNGSGHVCAGDMPGMNFTEFFSSYEPEVWEPSIDDFQDIHEPFWEGGRNDIGGQTATVTIPYEEFGGSSGQTIRLLILTSGFSGSKFPEVQLELK